MIDLEDIFLGDTSAGLKGDSAKIAGGKLNRNKAKTQAALNALTGLGLVKGSTTTLPPGSQFDFSLSGPGPVYALNMAVPGGAAGAGAPTSADILALADRDDLLREIAGAGVPDRPIAILDFTRGAHWIKGVYAGASILAVIAALAGSGQFRASTATYFDSDGLMKTAAVNVPRIDYDPVTRICRGYLREPARTNLALSNNFFVGGTVMPSWVSDVTMPAPDGSTADEVLVSGAWDTANAAGTRSNLKATATVVADTTYTVTAYVRKKPGGASGVQLRAFMPVGDATVLTFSVDDTNPQFVSGWYRLTGTFTPTVSGTMNIRMGTLASDDAPFYCWRRGLQVEEGNAPSSLIFASSSTVTRAADAMWIGASSWVNRVEGSVFVEFEAVTPASGNEQAINLGTDTVSDFIRLYRTASTGNCYVRSLSGGVSQVSTTSNMLWPSTPAARVAMGWKVNDAAWAWEGTLAGSTSAYSVPLVIPTLNIANSNAINPVTIKRILIYPKRLSNAKLQALTNQSLWS
ncbi:hypothetical protein [Bosea sp. (in: a-proteobacteria)]|uniref:phage head spike fiber domain-containing protein n=1 Tax=Bosea sp. (in: a-proteobacteria) TaxID=1871050 RepID=UPI001ACFB152|nr:hypothetical protein [Bosea sp. (in: a-proteobacteria)]MBN9438995.1 hypothetical protein [Bosea sp. (in: a-proteobacteria)]